MIFKKHEATIKVDGMHCPKCVARITEALKKIDGIKKVSISLDEKSVSMISKTEIPLDTVKATVEGLGFKII